MNNTELLLDMQLKHQLRKLVGEKGITITALAKATKVPAQTIHSWMSGAKPRNFDQVKSIADFFGVSLDFIAYGVLPQTSETLIQHKDEINAGVFEVVLRRVKRASK